MKWHSLSVHMIGDSTRIHDSGVGSVFGDNEDRNVAVNAGLRVFATAVRGRSCGVARSEMTSEPRDRSEG